MADSIGERLKQIRKKRGWTLRTLADVAQVPLSTLSAVETGTRPGHGLQLGTCKKLAVALQMSLDWLAFGHESASYSVTLPSDMTTPDGRVRVRVTKAEMPGTEALTEPTIEILGVTVSHPEEPTP